MKDFIHILFIEPNRKIRKYLTKSLRENGYQVTPAFSGREGIRLAAALHPNVILLDMELPRANSCNILRALRAQSDFIIIVISDTTEENAKVLALDLGADDYITKPIGPAELMARIRTCLRRSMLHMANHIYLSGDLRIDFGKHQVTLAGEKIHLTQIEYRLLTLLANNAGRVLTYNHILSTIWGPFENNNQILRVNMANIRRKIEKNPAQPEYVFTETGVGYRMAENEYEHT
ncbi:MAG: response regulator transcription factor [Acetatifactor sp.]